MKRLAVVSSAMLAGFVLAAFLLVILPRVGAGGAAPLPAGNGDTNGDGEINISDAVHLLIYLFRNGAPPVALADSPEVLERLRSLEERLDSLEPVRDELAATGEDIAELTERLDAHSDLTVLIANAKGRYSPSEDPERPNLFPMHYIADNNGGDGPLAVSGATIENEKIRFRIDRQGHIVLRVRGNHYSLAPQTQLWGYLDGVRMRTAFTQGPVSGAAPASLLELQALNVPAGDHEIVLHAWVSPGDLDTEEKLQTFLQQQNFEKCTLTVQFAPASAE